METDCNLNCDSILKKAKWLIIAAYVWRICMSSIFSLGIHSWILSNILNDNKDHILYLGRITMTFNILFFLLILPAYLYLRKYPNFVLKRSAKILLFTLIAEYTFIYWGNSFRYRFDIQPDIFGLIQIIIFAYFHLMAYGVLLKDKAIKKIYAFPIYLLCLGVIISKFSSITFFTFYATTSNIPLWNSNFPFSQVNSIAGLILGLAGYILIIFGWKQLLSTPSQIPITTSGTPISLKPTKIEYGYLVSCGVLIALLFIYFNSVSLDIFTK